LRASSKQSTPKNKKNRFMKLLVTGNYMIYRRAVHPSEFGWDGVRGKLKPEESKENIINEDIDWSKSELY